MTALGVQNGLGQRRPHDSIDSFCNLLPLGVEYFLQILIGLLPTCPQFNINLNRLTIVRVIAEHTKKKTYRRIENVILFEVGKQEKILFCVEVLICLSFFIFRRMCVIEQLTTNNKLTKI